MSLVILFYEIAEWYSRHLLIWKICMIFWMRRKRLVHFIIAQIFAKSWHLIICNKFKIYSTSFCMNDRHFAKFWISIGFTYGMDSFLYCFPIRMGMMIGKWDILLYWNDFTLFFDFTLMFIIDWEVMDIVRLRMNQMHQN